MSITPALDVARAQIFLAESSAPISGEIYNITGHEATYKDLGSLLFIIKRSVKE